jgi:excisionase family DNA binding protein
MESTNRVTVQEAARLLGISEGAVRARIHRGTLETAREGGTVYVRIDGEDTSKERTEQTELVQALREHNTTLERQLNAEREASAELRRIIAALTQRIPELEAPKQESPEAPIDATEQPGRVEDQAVIRSPQTSSERVPWWRRFFGGHEG